jgi:DNA-binding response OmpR family regulator
MAKLANQVLGKRAHILVVDDDLQLRESLLLGLRKMGYGAEAAEDGLQALHHLQHGRFDVVVTDLQMPHLDGLALLREIRRRGYTQAVVIQTTLLDPSLEVILRHAGACGVLMKGGPFSNLVRSVEEAYRISQGSHGPSPQGLAPGCMG